MTHDLCMDLICILVIQNNIFSDLYFVKKIHPWKFEKNIVPIGYTNNYP